MISTTTVKRRALGHRWVRDARALRELLRLVWDLSRTSLFDPELYDEQRGRHFLTRLGAAWHYVVIGSRQGLVPGPLLVPPVPATSRPVGLGPAASWASAVRLQRFPSATGLPVADLTWYADAHPEARVFRGGVLAHYAAVGRHSGFPLGPMQQGGTDLVELGRRVVRGEDEPAAQAPTHRAPAASGVSVVIASSDPIDTARRVIDVLLDPSCDVVEIAVITPGVPTPEGRLCASSLRLMSPVIAIWDAQPDALAGLEVALDASAGAVILLMTRRMSTTPEDVRLLLDAARAGQSQARVVTPVVLAYDDTVHAAGMVVDGDALTPLLRGYPLADAERMGERSLDAVSGEILVMNREALSVAVGFARQGSGDDTPTGAAARLSRQVAQAGGQVLIVPASTVELPREADDPPRPEGPDPTAAPVHADVALPPIQRWAIKSPHPAGPRRNAWGDYHFALALASSLSQLGHQVAVDPLDSWYRPTAVEDHVTLTLRGLSRYRPSPGQVNLSWIISHPELVHDDELDDFDAVFAASLSWSRRRTAAGHPIEPLLQCTDAQLFTPDAGEPGTGYPLLFIGNSRSARRPIVDAAISTGHDLTVIGGGWAGRIPPQLIRGEYVANALLPGLYRSAGVVLNDHWPDMAAEGFLSNRLFDLTAAGARWVSDPATDLLEVFPQGRVASDAAELARLLDGAPDTFPSEHEVREAAERIRAEHSFDVRARRLSDVALELLARRGERRPRRSGSHREPGGA